MTPFTSNYETIKETSLKDKSHDLALISGNMTTPNQDKIQSTFLQSVLSNKFVITLVLVVLTTGAMAFSANPVANYATTADVSITGGITGTGGGEGGEGGAPGSWCRGPNCRGQLLEKCCGPNGECTCQMNICSIINCGY